MPSLPDEWAWRLLSMLLDEYDDDDDGWRLALDDYVTILRRFEAGDTKGEP